MQPSNGSRRLQAFRERMTDLEKAKREVDKLRQAAIAELLDQRREINRELRQLGYEGSRTEDNGTTVAAVSAPASIESLLEPAPDGRRRRKRLQPRDVAGRHCPVCEINGHDLRAHRGQLPKRPFTSLELETRGLTGVGVEG